MSALDAVVASLAPHQVAGRFGVAVVGILGLPGEGEGPLRLHPVPGPRGALDVVALWDQPAPSTVSRAALGAHALVVRPRGEFLSTDRLAVAQVRREGDGYSIDLEVTRYESQDGEPAPRGLYVVLHLEPGTAPLKRVEIRFAGRQRDFDGNESPLPGPMAPAVVIDISG